MKEKGFKIGQEVRIIKNTYNHLFPIGTIVRLTEYRNMENDFKAEYLDRHDFWYVKPEEIEAISTAQATTITIYNTPGSPKVSAVMRRGDTVIKSAKAMCNATDTFNLDFGTELAVKRLFGWEEKAKPISLVKEVKRLAKVGEWVKITKNHADDRFKKDEKYKIMALSEDGSGLYVSHPQGRQCGTGYAYITGKDYVVLENYHPETPAKFRKAKVGDRIKIVKHGFHSPNVKVGAIFFVTGTGNNHIETDSNVFRDSDKEYIILNR